MLALWGLGCGDDAASDDPPASTTSHASSTGSGGPAAGTTDAADGASSSGSTTAPAECTALFGQPTPATGLTDEQCQPQCPCLDGWVAPTYDRAAIDALDAITLANPPDTLEADPYLTPDAFAPMPDKVCGVTVAGDSYTLTTFDGPGAAERAGATVTHDGACGLCSPLHDLGVYMRNGDLTEPVRACGLLGLARGEAANLQCLLDLGFTMPCAQIWLYNTINTRTICSEECLGALDAPYHEPDGSLNACLSCDEENSGPVFKAVAGRTRRNTGLPSALCRPCDDVNRIVHVYR